jgi:hypothetical protein
MHAAYKKDAATSAAPSFRDSVPATLPRQLRGYCLHAPPPLGSPPHSTQHHPMHSRRSQAPPHSAAARRCTQRTTEVQRRQLRHPSETRCQRRCPSFSDVIDCTHRRPSARPSRNPQPATAPCATASAHSTHHHPMHSRRSQAPAHSAAASDARSVPPRSSDVSCVIPARLGASDAAPSSLIRLPARPAAPRLAPSASPTHPLQPRAQPPQPTRRNIIHAQPAYAGTRSQRSCPPMHAA